MITCSDPTANHQAIGVRAACEGGACVDGATIVGKKQFALAHQEVERVRRVRNQVLETLQCVEQVTGKRGAGGVEGHVDRVATPADALGRQYWTPAHATAAVRRELPRDLLCFETLQCRSA